MSDEKNIELEVRNTGTLYPRGLCDRGINVIGHGTYVLIDSSKGWEEAVGVTNFKEGYNWLLNGKADMFKISISPEGLLEAHQNNERFDKDGFYE